MAIAPDTYDSSEQPCACGSGIQTRLRCSRCGKPICPRCMVASPVGYRCPDCARGPRPVVYNPGVSGLLKAAGVGLVLAVAIGAFWGYFPSWGFYMALLLGFGVAEGMAWAANYKKGRELQALSFVMVLLGLVVSRVAIGVFDPVLTVDMLLNQTSHPFVRHFFYLDIVPDFVFMALPFLICFVRFR